MGELNGAAVQELRPATRSPQRYVRYADDRGRLMTLAGIDGISITWGPLSTLQLPNGFPMASDSFDRCSPFHQLTSFEPVRS